MKNIFKRNKDMQPSVKKAKRTVAGNIVLGIILALLGFLFFFPVLFMINTAFKPLNEMFMFPPKLFVQNPTTNNFSDLMRVLANSLVPFSRYLFNTVYIVVMGSVLVIFFGALCAYPLAKYRFPGSMFIWRLIEFSLMFSAALTSIPSFILISRMGLIDTYASIILPSLGTTLGLYLMKGFIEQIPDSLIEAARIDGATQVGILIKIIMPLVKPALVTAFINTFQSFWGATGGSFIYEERLKTVAYMLSQIASGSNVGIARQGVLAAASLIMFLIPVGIFCITQSNVISTMATSGMKD